MSFATDCPVCDSEMSLADDTILDELMECDDCGCELVVSSLDPLALDEAPMAEEDWGQ